MYCVHANNGDQKFHAADDLKKRFGLALRCVHGEGAAGHPDHFRLRVHLAAVELAIEEGHAQPLFVESSAYLSENPEALKAGPEAMFEMLCLSGSASLIRMSHSDCSGKPVITDLEDAEKDLEKSNVVNIGERDPRTGRWPRAVVEKGEAVSVTLSKMHYSELKRRGLPMDTLTRLADSLSQITHVEGAPTGRKKWALGLPTTLSCYYLKGDGVEKTKKLLRYTVAESPLPNVLSFEKHVRDRVECYLLLRPLCDAKPEIVRDYVHVLSGLKRSIQTSRKPREIRGPKMSPDGKSVYLGVLPEDQLPKVSILTITRNRRRIFNIATYMVKNTRYPKDRLEWVIVDDSDDGEDAYPSLGSLKDDPMVVYRRLRTDQGRPFRIGHKRQMSCELATGDIFVHLDDDDFLPPEGVMVRTRALLEYNASCMGATHMLSHVYKTGRTFFTTVADVYGDLVCFGEPSIAYTREFWKERPWNSEVHMDEGRYFLLGRDYDRFLNVQSHFHCVALTHGKNITGTLRDGKDIVNARNFDRSELFPPDLVRLLDSAFR